MRWRRVERPRIDVPHGQSGGDGLSFGAMTDSRPAPMTAAMLPNSRLVPPVPLPPERELPILPFIRTMRVNGIACWPREAYDAPVRRRRVLGRMWVTVSDPEAVRRVFVENAENYVRSPISIRILRPLLGDELLIASGADWRHQRRTLSPAFTPKAVALITPQILAACDATVASLRGEAARGPLDLYAALQRMTLEIAGRSMFSVGMARHGETLRSFVEAYGARLGRPHMLDALLPLSVMSPVDIARALFRRRWVRFLDSVIAEREREARPTEARDLLDLLKTARDPENGEPFPPEILRYEVATLMLAGHETTAITLLWAMVLLALSPETQARVHAEARSDPSDGTDPAALPFARAVIDETLRLYPQPTSWRGWPGRPTCWPANRSRRVTSSSSRPG